LKILYIIFFLFFSFLTYTEENIVVVISMDGVRHDYPNLLSGGGFNFISEKGLVATSLVPMYQSSTFPTHVTMATGVTPDKHGILHNGFFDRNRGFYSYSPDASWIESEPIWSLLERQGIKTATYFWVGSESDWEGTKITYSKAPFNGRISEKDKTKQILDWLDLEPKERPRLIMTWWHGSDSIAHQSGSINGKVLNQLRKQDKELLNLITEIEKRGYWENITLIVVSDHGMSDVDNFINIKEILKNNSIDSTLSIGPAIGHVFLDDLSDKDSAISALKQDSDLIVWDGGELPENYNMFHPTRTGDIVVETHAPNMLVTRKNSNPPKGMHGYDPSRNKEMEGIFYAYGNKVSINQINKVSQLDLAPTILNLLEIEAPSYMTGQSIALD
tara:strand:- start:217 stop:1380 length:1164 start_codon:yes stop_codon:yes gene_type:complete